MGGLGGGLEGGVAQRGPAEQRALDAGGELGDPRERDGVLEDLLVGLDAALALHHLQEPVVQVQRPAGRATDQQIGHHRRRRLRDRTALRVVGDVADRGAVEVDAQGELVPARRVDVMDLHLVGLTQPRVMLLTIVNQDDRLVHLVDVHV